MSAFRSTRCGMAKRIYIGFSSDGMEIVATYTTRGEADELRQSDEIVTGPWMRVPRAAKKTRRAKR